MRKINISVPDEMFAEMRKHPNIDWNKVVIERFIEYLEMLDDLKEVTQAKKEYKKGKGIKFSDLKKELNLE